MLVQFYEFIMSTLPIKRINQQMLANCKKELSLKLIQYAVYLHKTFGIIRLFGGRYNYSGTS